MTTAAEVTSRVDVLAARVARAPIRKRWPIGPLRRVLYYGVTLDHLECGHRVRAAEHPVPRRHCGLCGRGVPMREGNAIDQAKRDGR